MAENNGLKELSEHEFEEFTKDGVKVIDFFAEWCMPCLMMAPIIEDLSEQFKDKIGFAKLNIDDNSGLAGKLKVMSIPTLIVYKDGEEVDRITGAIPGEQLEEKFNGFL